MAPSKKKQIFTETLILDIQSHRALWDKTSKDHKDIGMCANAWNDIKANLEASHSEEVLRSVNLNTVKGIKSHWKNLQDTYRTKKRQSKGKSGAGREQVKDPKKWAYFEMLRFLDQTDAFGVSTSSHVHLPEDDQSTRDEEEEEDEDEAEEEDDDEDDAADNDNSLPKRLRSEPIQVTGLSDDQITNPTDAGNALLLKIWGLGRDELLLTIHQKIS